MTTTLIRELWCNDCQEWQPVTQDADGDYSCKICWEYILCDECGYGPWNFDHECEGSSE